MHCTLCYPTKPRCELGALIDIKKNFKNNILGLSDHTLGVILFIINFIWC